MKCAPLIGEQSTEASAMKHGIPRAITCSSNGAQSDTPGEKQATISSRSSGSR